MEGIIRLVMGLLAALAGLYSLLILIRIILTWFGPIHYRKPILFLAAITDPYLNWWRQKLNLRAGTLDLSPIAAMAALSVLQTICSAAAIEGRISLRIILSVCFNALWSAISFILGFCLIVLVLRFIAYMINSDMHSTFWRVVDSISRPLLYRINRMIFGKRLVNFTTGIIVAIIALAVVWIAGGLLVEALTRMLTAERIEQFL